MSFSTADYPGWCATSIDNQNGNLTVYFSCCADVDDGGMTYSSNSLTSVTIHYASVCTCIYTYGPWGACDTVSNTQMRVVTSQSPAGATCSNVPQTTQSCDVTPPKITISTPIAGTIITATSQPITYSYSDNIKVTAVSVYDNNNRLAETTINNVSGSNYYNWQTNMAGEGQHTIVIKALDAAGNYGMDQRQVMVDLNPPTVALTSPSAAGATITGKFTISASASDTGSGIKEVKFFLDSTSNQLGSTLTATPYSYSWDSTTVTNGGHRIYVYATDKADRTNYTYFDVTVNNPTVTGPVVVFASPMPGSAGAAITVSDKVDLRVNVTPSSSPVVNVKFFLSNTSNQLGPTLTATPYSYSWDTRDIANGNYSIYAVATDTAGVSGSAHIYVNVQNITISSDDNNAVTCTYTCSEWGVCTAEGKQSCLNFTHTPTTGTCSEPEPISKTQNCTYVSEATTGTIIVKNKVVNDGGGSKKVSDFSFSVNGKTAIAFNSSGENDLKKDPGIYTITVPAVENYVTTYDKCSNIDLDKGETVTCTVTNTYKAPAAAAVKCEYSCNKWSDCSTANIKTCIDIAKTPAGCLDWITTAPALDCQYQPLVRECIFTCAKWGDCTAEGKKQCLVYAHTPVDATCSNAPSDLLQTCEYTAKTETASKIDFKPDATQSGAGGPDKTNEIISKKSSSKNKSVECEYVYSAYGACINNKQTRIVLSKSPENCQESVKLPELEQDCDSSKVEMAVRPLDAPAPVPEAVTVVGVANAQQNQQLNNYNGRTSGEWQKYYFGLEFCADAAFCGGDADPDNDGLSNNEEYRFGTDPKVADTDNDGRVDGGEVIERRDPLVAAGAGAEDQMAFEDPKESSAGNEGIYEVANVETVGGEKGSKIVKLSGKALPNAYINLVVFSDPVVITVKTNEDGSWSYVLDDPLPEGEHQVYIVATSNTGKIVAKSNAFGFVQTAEAAVAIPNPGATVDRAPAPTKARASEGYLLLGLFSLLGLALAIIAIGLIRNKSKGGEPLP